MITVTVADLLLTLSPSPSTSTTHTYTPEWLLVADGTCRLEGGEGGREVGGWEIVERWREREREDL